MYGPSGGLSRTAVTGAPARERHFVTFRLGRWEFAAEVADVCGIYHGLAIIPTPDDADAVAGEVNLSGRRVPVVDLRHILGLNPHSTPGWMLGVGQGTDVVVLLVDSVSEVIRVHPRAVQTGADSSARELPASLIISAAVRHRNGIVYVPDWRRLLARCSAS